jgi:ABC-type tungstate transport system permease subunit
MPCCRTIGCQIRRCQEKNLVEGDRRQFNQYGVILVNPEKHPNVKVAEGQAFVYWLISPEGQWAIAAYKINGEQLFFPNADIIPTARHSANTEGGCAHADA